MAVKKSRKTSKTNSSNGASKSQILNKEDKLNLEKLVGKIKKSGKVFEERFESYEESVSKLLDKAKFKSLIKKEKKIVLKPNLSLCKAFPVTTDSSFVEAVIKYIQKNNKSAKIFIAEASKYSDTLTCFENLGYKKLSEKYHVPLIDLNKTETIPVKNKQFKIFKSINYPKELIDSFLISLPVLKAHSKATVSISLKNMLGCISFQNPQYERIRSSNLDYTIHDALACKFPDYAICDASMALLEHEVNGFIKEIGLLLAGDTIAVDEKGAFLLGYDSNKISHISLAKEI